MTSKDFRCPDCSSHRGYRSRPRNFVEKYLMPLVFLRAWRCADCAYRFYASSSVRTKDVTSVVEEPPFIHRTAA